MGPLLLYHYLVNPEVDSQLAGRDFFALFRVLFGCTVGPTSETLDVYVTLK